MSWISLAEGCGAAPETPRAEMEMREVLRTAADLTIGPVRPEPERARRSMLVVTPHRGAEVLVG